MGLIVETDLGGDFDDWFAITYLLAAGVDIKAILVTPGYPDQVALAALIRKRCDKDFLIGIHKTSQSKNGAHGVYNSILDYCGMGRDAIHDGQGQDIITKVLDEEPGTEFLVIGPPKSCGLHFGCNQHFIHTKLTMQGGFLGYDVHDVPIDPKYRLEKFEGKTASQSFNPNGDRWGTDKILESSFVERRFVGKNVCHCIEFNNTRKIGEAKDEASALFGIGAKLYFNRHSSKKFHDPVAAVLHRHPDLGQWVRGYVDHDMNGWSTLPSPEGTTEVLAALDEEKFWEYIANWQ